MPERVVTTFPWAQREAALSTARELAHMTGYRHTVRRGKTRCWVIRLAGLLEVSS